jgi:radical SAM superfamily enzyme with C-terminal helix-hairpin-helix motif
MSMNSGKSSNSLVKHDISPFRVLIAGTSWRLFGSERAAETLLQAMSGDDEQNRMLAGMSLVKAGQRSFDLIEKKIEAGQASAPVIRLLPDIGGDRARAVLDRIAAGEPGEMADAARECVSLLDRIESLEAHE